MQNCTPPIRTKRRVESLHKVVGEMVRDPSGRIEVPST